MIAKVFDLLFGCRHKQLTRPITRVHRPGTPAGLVYVCCLECGKQFRYDVESMTVGAPVLPAPEPTFGAFTAAQSLVRDPLSSR